MNQDKWEKEFEKLFEFWVSNYVYADDAFDLDLRSEVWKDELESFIRQLLASQKERMVADFIKKAEEVEKDNPYSDFRTRLIMWLKGIETIQDVAQSIIKEL